MSLRSDRLTALLFGANRTRNRRALVLAGAFVVFGATIEYLLFRTGFENGVVETFHEVFLLTGYLPSQEGTGAVFVVGLAALHAYLNEGYLPSLLLGWSVVFGNLSWTLVGLSGTAAYRLDLPAAFERTFPEAAALATLGFVMGVGLRRLRKRWRTQTASRARSESGGVRSTE